MTTHVWLRAESKPHERRSALMPDHVAKLMAAGFHVTVERCQQRAVDDERFRATGCHMAPAHAWKNEAPQDAFILGLKEIEKDQSPLHHRHIHFEHVYKDQAGWQSTLQRFADGGGALYDLEFLVDESGRRVAAFGHWAGFVGAGLAILGWVRQSKRSNENDVLPALAPYASATEFVVFLQDELSDCDRLPSVLVIGALGRSGGGAKELCDILAIPTTSWDLAETAVGGPFEETLSHDVLVNCVFVQTSTPPFLTRELLARTTTGRNDARRLRVICDVSCDPLADYNPLPIYEACTTFDAPTVRIDDTHPPVDLIAIDHLPSLLPLESSEDFGNQLLPSLLTLDRLEEGVWARARHLFDDKLIAAAAQV